MERYMAEADTLINKPNVYRFESRRFGLEFELNSLVMYVLKPIAPKNSA